MQVHVLKSSDNRGCECIDFDHQRTEGASAYVTL
jgi:hypothetical protein